MKKASMALITGGILICGGLGIYGYTRALQAQPTQPSPPQPVQPTVVGALGRLEPEGEVVDINASAGASIGEMLVVEGQQVERGTPLVRLESYPERLAERNYAASQLAEARKRLQAETIYGQTQIQEARTRLAQIDEPQQREMEAQKATIRGLEAELADAQTNLRRFEDLFGQGAVSQQELDARKLTVRSKEESLRSAQARLGNLEASRTTNMENVKAQMRSAEANLLLAQSQVQIASLQRNLELAEARLRRTIIRAPRAGQVIRILRSPGETISTDEAILQFGNTNQMMVVAEVYETDIPRVRLGQPAQIRSDVFPSSLRGSVTQIGLQIRKKDVLNTDPAADVDARVVEVRIKLDPESSRQAAALTNMQVRVEITPPNS